MKTSEYRQSANRSYRMDILKAAAIICVVLYHSGNLSFGYLGVEVFFVIAGYYFINSFLKQKNQGSFRLVSFLTNRILRLWPLIIFVCLLCLIIGFFTMLPDDFENLSETAVASAAFANNILSAITTKDYWNIGNNYSPLMHLWYVGVLVQSYIVMAVVFSLFDRMGRKVLKQSVFLMTLLSLLLFLLPSFSSGDKFYFIPFRLFEVLFGVGVFFAKPKEKISSKTANILYFVLLLLICAIMIFGTPFSSSITLITVVLLTCAAIYVGTNSDETENGVLNAISKIGSASFSIYVIHQPIMAFTRYFFTAELKNGVLFVDLLLTTVLALVLYFIFEKGFNRIIKRSGWIKSAIICTACSGITIIVGFAIFLHAGVVRDVPELDVYKGSAYHGMHSEYVDIPYSWNKEFTTHNIRVFVIGDSMGRDWCNILNESNRSSELEISYVFVSDYSSNPQMYANRINTADYIFYATIGDSTINYPKPLADYINNDNFYVVGIKNFGESNGQVYQKRNDVNYFNASIMLGESALGDGTTYEQQNTKQRNQWGSHYIDMIECIRNADGSIPVFTDTHKFISADTEHLTKNGAIYYGKILDLSFIK